MHINCRSIYNKIHETDRLAEMTKATNIIAVTETWLDQNITNITRIADFNFEHISRTFELRGGGVDLLIHHIINYELIDLKSNYTTFESISAKIELENKKKLIVTCIYRPQILL